VSYTVMIGDIPVGCDTVPEVLELVAHLQQADAPPDAPADAPPPREAQAQTFDGITSRWYRCRVCGYERWVTANFKRFPSKTMACDRSGCDGDCERVTPDPPGGPATAEACAAPG
jgi:hypothetical protein